MIISNSLTSTEVPSLLIGFNKIDFLRARINEISPSMARALFLSIDGKMDYQPQKWRNLQTG
jgi:hypothetical protein